MIINCERKYFHTLLQDFACKDLYSLILKKDGNLKTRLMVYTGNGSSNFIPIHRHKYLDRLEYLFGDVIDLIYERGGVLPFNEYEYSRVSDGNKPLVKTGNIVRLNLKKVFTNKSHDIPFSDFHTVMLTRPSAWIIHEIQEDPDFDSSKQLCYSMCNISGSPGTHRSTNIEHVIDTLRENGYELNIGE